MSTDSLLSSSTFSIVANAGDEDWTVVSGSLDMVAGQNVMVTTSTDKYGLCAH